VHIFDFHQDIYGEKIKVDVLKKIRNEKQFASLEELKYQIQNDKLMALNIF
jgi:riboflavin kinase/FMN adenylyltransferase